MSRSNPNDHLSNPSKRWFEWNGEHGAIRYYDKEKKQDVEVAKPFTFLLLDQLGTVQGWHDASNSGIYANEVKDTRQERLIVKAFKGGVLAEGLYRDIKDRVNSVGGQFVTNSYIAFKNGGDGLVIGSMRFKGAALHAWSEFTRAHRNEIWNKAITIDGSTEGKKGRITFYTPTFKLSDPSAETNKIAADLDKELQRFLAAYFTRTTKDRVAEPPPHDPDEPPPAEYEPPPPTQHVTDDDIPF